MASKYKFSNPDGLYFITYTIVEWIDVFTRPIYKDLIVDSLQYSMSNKGLNLYAWVIMSNHVHLIASAKEGFELYAILRDHKKFTSKKLSQRFRKILKKAVKTG